MQKRKIGELIDSLGVLADLADDDMVTDVVVISKVVQSDGQVAISVETGEATTWFDQLALITAAVQIERSNPITRED